MYFPRYPVVIVNRSTEIWRITRLVNYSRISHYGITTKHVHLCVHLCSKTIREEAWRKEAVELKSKKKKRREKQKKTLIIKRVSPNL